jgi:hypothetical protein
MNKFANFIARPGAIAAGIVWLLVPAAALHGAVLTAVPRQGGMLMPEVYYHADTDSVTVDLTEATSIIPQLTPLLVSHPNDRFDPNDPWYDQLDPSGQGLAFSRRYGFDMDPMTDFLAEGRELWIRKLSSSPGVSFYDYNDFVSPKTWNPIFGTAGASNATSWSGLMWHFGVTAPPGTNTHTAVFEIYVLDTTSGVEVANSSTGPFELTWTTVPDGRPELTITGTAANQVVVAWPATATNWFLVSSTNLDATGWIATTNPVTTLDDRSSVILSNAAARQFFRLQRNP